jgi:hypothetical protein
LLKHSNRFPDIFYTNKLTVMRKYFIPALVSIVCSSMAVAQSTAKINPRPITDKEYKKAKTFRINDLDKDTYVKFENKYVLDRYEMRKPYFVTGDDGKKKRIDLYKLYSRDSMQELGVVIYYTNENGKLYTAVQPSSNSDAAVWNEYFEDIHAIEKEEKNFVLKLSYILSKEMSFQLYKSLNKDAPADNGTYGTDICFPGDEQVTMADGGKKYLRQIQKGDKVLTIDPVTKTSKAVTVKELAEHPVERYAITRLLLVSASETESYNSINVLLSNKMIEATPNHPVQTTHSKKKIGEVETGDEIICFDENTNSFKTYTVNFKTEIAQKEQKVYNIVAEDGETMIINNVMVLQK